jgi:hypothetical protein
MNSRIVLAGSPTTTSHRAFDANAHLQLVLGDNPKEEELEGGDFVGSGEDGPTLDDPRHDPEDPIGQSRSVEGDEDPVPHGRSSCATTRPSSPRL